MAAKADEQRPQANNYKLNSKATYPTVTHHDVIEAKPLTYTVITTKPFVYVQRA